MLARWGVALLAVAVLVFPATVEAAFPGANGKIVFVRAEGPGHNDIWTIDPDGSAEVNITNTPSVSEFHPSWSADGSQIAFMRGGAIWVMNQDGFGQHEVVPAPNNPTCPPGTSLSGSGLLNPAWSPDGSKLVFTNLLHCRVDTESPNVDLYTVNSDGTAVTLLTSQGDQARWSPDGSKIGYTRTCYGGGCTNLGWVTPDGSTTEEVWDSGVSADFFWDWSPDASLMTGCGEGPALPNFAGCYTIRPDGTGRTDLSNNVRPEVWSPDGKKFLWGFSNIFTGNVDGTGVTMLTSGGDPDWQPIPLNTDPDCSSATAAPGTLWPANERFVRVRIAGVTDPDGDQVTVTVTGVTQDEPTGRDPDATVSPAGQNLRVRAERDTRDDGRVYRIDFEATDGEGTCEGTVTVSVPRHRHRPVVDSAPPSYDSFVATSDGARRR